MPRPNTRSKSKAEVKKEAEPKPNKDEPKKKKVVSEQITTVVKVPEKRTYSAVFDNIHSEIELLPPSTKRMRLSSEETDKTLIYQAFCGGVDITRKQDNVKEPEALVK